MQKNTTDIGTKAFELVVLNVLIGGGWLCLCYVLSGRISDPPVLIIIGGLGYMVTSYFAMKQTLKEFIEARKIDGN